MASGLSRQLNEKQKSIEIGFLISALGYKVILALGSGSLV